MWMKKSPKDQSLDWKGYFWYTSIVRVDSLLFHSFILSLISLHWYQSQNNNNPFTWSFVIFLKTSVSTHSVFPTSPPTECLKSSSVIGTLDTSLIKKSNLIMMRWSMKRVSTVVKNQSIQEIETWCFCFVLFFLCLFPLFNIFCFFCFVFSFLVIQSVVPIISLLLVIRWSLTSAGGRTQYHEQVSDFSHSRNHSEIENFLNREFLNQS